MYPRGGARTVNVANPTNGYAAEKGISKVVSDGEWKPYVLKILRPRGKTCGRIFIACNGKKWYNVANLTSKTRRFASKEVGRNDRLVGSKRILQNKQTKIWLIGVSI